MGNIFTKEIDWRIYEKGIMGGYTKGWRAKTQNGTKQHQRKVEKD